MEKNSQTHHQEIIYGSSDPTSSRQISKLEKEGTIRKIASKIYTSNFEGRKSYVNTLCFTFLSPVP